MSNTLFIASFPDLSIFDFSKTGISIKAIDTSEHYFLNKNNYLNTYVASLKNQIGKCDIVIVQPNNKVISSLMDEGIDCIVLYPKRDAKASFLKELKKSRVDADTISMIEDSWDFFISSLERKNYKYKIVIDENDNLLDVLKTLLKKRKELGVGPKNINNGINDDLVNDLFSYCLMQDDELENGKPKITYKYCEGIKYDYLFSSERIASKRNDIKSLINSIRSIEDGISVGSMGINKKGEVWTHSFDTLEKVMALGICSGQLCFPFPRTYDQSLKGALPYVIKSENYFKNIMINTKGVR